jgi:exosortase
LALLIMIGALLTRMIPMPSLIFDQVVHPLQLMATKLAAVLLRLAGVPVLLNGDFIHLDALLLYVPECCSGIRSLLALVTLALIYGYLIETRIWVRVVLACSAVPVGVAATSFRIFGTGLMSHYWDLDTAERFFHVYSGWLIFVLKLIALFILHRVISFIWKSSPEPKSA